MLTIISGVVSLLRLWVNVCLIIHTLIVPKVYSMAVRPGTLTRSPSLDAGKIVVLLE